MPRWMLPTTWWCRCLWIVATFAIATDLLPDALLALVNSTGYLPYSDRPGPGWQSPHLPSVQELAFFGGFALLVLRSSAFYGVIFAAAGLVLGFCSLPRWGLRVLAVPTGFLASGLIMASVGWMIAISSAGVYIAAGCGAFWGFFVFPRLVPQMDYALPITARLTLAFTLAVGGTYGLVKPLLPDSGLTNAKIEIIRRDDAGSELSQVDLNHIGPSIPK